jgi:hypothetical protein
MRKNKYSDSDILSAVAASTSWRGVCRYFGVSPLSGSQSHLKNRAISANADFSHFNGKSWSKGLKLKSKRRIEDYLENKVFITSSRLRKLLISSGIKENKCEMCEISLWLGYPAPLELDHINGNHFDNNISNLMILCSNCHSIKTKLRP